MATSSPKPIDKVENEGRSQAFIPYAPIGEKLEHIPIYVRPDAYYYAARMAFFPNCNKMYLHVPWIAEHLFRLNNALMRDERNALDEHFKYRLSMVASHVNDCPYCVSHHACLLKRRWEYRDDDLRSLLDATVPRDARESAAMEFVRHACKDPGGVTDKLRGRLAREFTPQEVMEIVMLAGFWKMYNTMHLAMALPIEDPALGFEEWTRFGRPEQDGIERQEKG